MKKKILPPEVIISRKPLLGLNDVFKIRDLCDPPTKPQTPTDVPRVKVQSKNPTRVPRVKLHSNDPTRSPWVQPPAATPSPQTTPQLYNRIRNLSKPIVSHNANSTIHLSSLEEQFISDMMNINAILDHTTGDLLELRQLCKNPDAKIWRYGAFNE